MYLCNASFFKQAPKSNSNIIISYNDLVFAMSLRLRPLAPLRKYFVRRCGVVFPYNSSDVMFYLIFRLCSFTCQTNIYSKFFEKIISKPSSFICESSNRMIFPSNGTKLFSKYIFISSNFDSEFP